MKSISWRITTWYVITATSTLACLFVAGHYLLQNYLIRQLDVPLRIGLVHGSVEEIDTAIDGIVKQLKTSGPEAVRECKKLISYVGSHGLTDAIPYTIDGETLRFYSANPGTVRVLAGEKESVYSLTVPEVGDLMWQIPTTVKRGVPRRTPIENVARDIWYWLALAGLGCLLAEWLIYGKYRMRLKAAAQAGSRPTPMFERKAS